MSNNEASHGPKHSHDSVINKNADSGNASPKHVRIFATDNLNSAVPHQLEEIILEREKSHTRREVRRAQSFEQDESQKALFTPIFMKQCIVMTLWFFTSFASIVLNKYLLSTLDVDASLLGACQIVMTTFFGSIVMYVPYICNWTSRKRHKKMENFNRYQFYKTMSILGWLRCGAVICSVIGLKYVAVSFSETIKSSAPLFTALFAYFLLKEYSGIYVNLSLMPIMFGLAISTYSELSFNMTGFLAACTNNILDCIQNVFSKKLLSGDDMKFTPLELQFYTSVAATVVQVPLWFFFIDLTLKFKTTDSYVASMLLFNGVVFYLQSLFAYSLMSLISPVTFSVSNTVKRAGLIWFSILVFGNKVTLLNLFGTVLVVTGVFLYQRARMKEQHKRDQLVVDEKLNHGNKEKGKLLI